jgi:hypothetical protein
MRKCYQLFSCLGTDGVARPFVWWIVNRCMWVQRVDVPQSSGVVVLSCHDIEVVVYDCDGIGIEFDVTASIA